MKGLVLALAVLAACSSPEKKAQRAFDACPGYEPGMRPAQVTCQSKVCTGYPGTTAGLDACAVIADICASPRDELLGSTCQQACPDAYKAAGLSEFDKKKLEWCKDGPKP